MLKITNQLIYAEALSLGWKAEILDEDVGVIRYISPSGRTYLVKSVTSHATSAMHLILADHKYLFYRMAEEWGIKVPKTRLSGNWKQAVKFLGANKPIVVKPESSGHGQGITTDINSEQRLKRAIKHAQNYSENVLLQEQVAGEDYRLLFIGGKPSAAAIRHPATVQGDGKSSINTLIKNENKSEKRGSDYEKPLNYIDTKAARLYLGKRIYSVPQSKQIIQVVGTANIGTGGYSEDVTDSLDPRMLRTAQKLVNELKIPVCGVDFIAGQDTSYVIEINASPSFGLHTFPRIGKPRNVAKDFLNWLKTT